MPGEVVAILGAAGDGQLVLGIAAEGYCHFWIVAAEHVLIAKLGAETAVGQRPRELQARLKGAVGVGEAVGLLIVDASACFCIAVLAVMGDVQSAVRDGAPGGWSLLISLVVGCQTGAEGAAVIQAVGVQAQILQGARAFAALLSVGQLSIDAPGVAGVTAVPAQTVVAAVAVGLVGGSVCFFVGQKPAAAAGKALGAVSAESEAEALGLNSGNVIFGVQ